MDEEDNANASLDNEEEVDKIQLEIQNATRGAEKVSCRQSRKMNSDDDKLIRTLKNITTQDCETTLHELGEDSLFLVSLVLEMHMVSADRKLKLKSNIIAAICHTQQTQQYWSQLIQYPGPVSYTHLVGIIIIQFFILIIG